jgi:hypothetical protein
MLLCCYLIAQALAIAVRQVSGAVKIFIIDLDATSVLMGFDGASTS